VNRTSYPEMLVGQTSLPHLNCGGVLPGNVGRTERVFLKCPTRKVRYDKGVPPIEKLW
jgi:hypothetical protein